MNYYNDNDPQVCAWAKELIKEGLVPNGEVDCRSIVDVRPEDLKGFTQCHFFSGILGWSYALHLAGWPEDRPVWTGSCPCQPLSCAGQRKGHADERHLWPAFYKLIAERRPTTVFGEQVASKLGLEWLCGVRADLEGIGYACGAADLSSASVQSPQNRKRIFWVSSNPNNRTGFGQMGREWNSQKTTENIRKGNLFFWKFESKPEPLAHGIPGRVGLLRGYGNSICPQVAEEFIRAFSEGLKD